MAKLALLGGKPIVGKNKQWASWPVSDKKDAELVSKITLSNRWSYDGPTEWKFAEAFAKYQGAKYGLCCANGTVGIQLALESLGIGAHDEVIVPGITWQATAAACVDVNAIPILTDVEPDTWNLDLAAVEANITKRTKAVIVVHLYGAVTDIAGLVKLCKKHNLFLIEDCAHAVGSYWKGKHAGTYGDLGVFSFQEFKQLSTGDGGMTTTMNTELMDKMANVWAFSGESPHFMCLNYRMTAVTAAIGLAQLGKVGDIITYYNKTLAILNDAIKDCRWLKPRLVPADAKMSAYWFACAWEGDKYGLDYNRFKKLDKELGIGLRFGFNEQAPYEFDFFREAHAYGHPDCPVRCPIYTAKSDYRYKKGLCPNVEDVMPRLVTVRLIFLSMDEAKVMAEKLREAIRLMEK